MNAMRRASTFALVLPLVASHAVASPIHLDIGGWDGQRTVRFKKVLPSDFQGGVIPLGRYLGRQETLQSGFDLALIFRGRTAPRGAASLVSVSGPLDGSVVVAPGGHRLTGGFGGTADSASVVGFDTRAGVPGSTLAPFLDPARVHLVAQIKGHGRGILSTELVIDHPTPTAPSRIATASAPSRTAAAQTLDPVATSGAPAAAAQTFDPGTSTGTPLAVPEPSVLVVLLAGVAFRRRSRATEETSHR
jgi:hypothetical protein